MGNFTRFHMFELAFNVELENVSNFLAVRFLVAFCIQFRQAHTTSLFSMQLNF